MKGRRMGDEGENEREGDGMKGRGMKWRGMGMKGRGME